MPAKTSASSLSALVAGILGWSSRGRNNYGTEEWVDPCGRVHLALPAFAALDGPLSPMLTWLDARGFIVLIEIDSVRAVCKVCRLRPEALCRAEGKTVNESVAKCVLTVAELEKTKEQTNAN
jgi:hypothetical protein